MVGIVSHRAHPVEIKSLAVENIFDQAFFKHFHQVFIRTSACKTGFPAACAEDIGKIDPYG